MLFEEGKLYQCPQLYFVVYPDYHKIRLDASGASNVFVHEKKESAEDWVFLTKRFYQTDDFSILPKETYFLALAVYHCQGLIFIEILWGEKRGWICAGNHNTQLTFRKIGDDCSPVPEHIAEVSKP